MVKLRCYIDPEKGLEVVGGEFPVPSSGGGGNSGGSSKPSKPDTSGPGCDPAELGPFDLDGPYNKEDHKCKKGYNENGLENHGNKCKRWCNANNDYRTKKPIMCVCANGSCSYQIK